MSRLLRECVVSAVVVLVAGAITACLSPAASGIGTNSSSDVAAWKPSNDVTSDTDITGGTGSSATVKNYGSDVWVTRMTVAGLVFVIPTLVAVVSVSFLRHIRGKRRIELARDRMQRPDCVVNAGDEDGKEH